MIKQKEHIFGRGNSQGSSISKKNGGINYSRQIMIANRIMLTFIIVLGVSYMLSVNDLSIKGFVLNDLKAQINDLEKEGGAIEAQVAQLESNSAINTRAQQLAMVRVDKIEYITLTDGKVAKK